MCMYGVMRECSYPSLCPASVNWFTHSLAFSQKSAGLMSGFQSLSSVYKEEKSHQSFTIDNTVSGRRHWSSLPGSFCSSSFFSDPIRLVQSYSPLSCPLAFFFSQTENEIPQDLQHCMQQLALMYITCMLSKHIELLKY